MPAPPHCPQWAPAWTGSWPLQPLVIALSIKDRDRDEVARLFLGSVLARAARQPREQRRRLAALVAVVIARAARGGCVVVGAGLAGIEVRQRLAQVVLDHLQLHD